MALITKKAKEIKEIVSLGLDKVFSEEGFKFNKSSNEFRMQSEGFLSIFNMEQVAWSDHFSINVNLWISQKDIERILEKIIGRTRHKITLGDDIARISKSPDGRKIVNGNLAILLIHDEDIEAAIDTLKQYFFEIAKPYFAKYNSLQALDDIINNEPFSHCPAHVGGNFDERCMKGLIVARLVSNPKYNELASIYDEAIKETMSSESIENYYKVREYLMYNRR